MKTILFWMFFAFMLTLTVPAMAAPGLIDYQGRLTNPSGQAITTTVSITFTFWSAETGGAQLGGAFSDTDSVRPDASGICSTLIGDHPSNLIPSSIFSGNSVWLNVRVNSKNLTPRKRIVSVGYALRSNNADMATTANRSLVATQADNADKLDGQHSSAFAAASHPHNLQNLGGAVTDAQVPNNITINMATTASRSLVATQADNADKLDGQHSSAFAAASHPHNLQNLGGAVTDAQVPNNITINMATTASRSLVATQADNADKLDGQHSTAFAAASHPHSLQNLGGAVTDAQVPDNITINLAQAALTLQGARFVVVQTVAKPAANGDALLAAYGVAKRMEPSSGDPVTVIVPPGQYDLGSEMLILDTPWINLAGLTTARETQHIFGTSDGANTGVLMQTADQVLIENLTVECTLVTGGSASDSAAPAAYWPNVAWNGGAKHGSSPNTTIRNCEFISDDTHSLSMRRNIEYAGTYDRCKGGHAAFGTQGTASGTFTHCTGGGWAFGGYLGTASGTFTDCTGGNVAFGGDHGTATGTFTNCAGGDSAFGGWSGTTSGTFTNCTGGNYAFGGGNLGTASGKFTHCTGGDDAFGGGQGTASGTFSNCTGGERAYAGSGGTASGRFTGCTGGKDAFGGYMGVASGTFSNCTGGDRAFGGYTATASGTFSNCTGGHYAFGGGGTASGTFTDCTGGAYAFGGGSSPAPGGEFYHCVGGYSSFTENGAPAPVQYWCIQNGIPYPGNN